MGAIGHNQMKIIYDDQNSTVSKIAAGSCQTRFVVHTSLAGHLGSRTGEIWKKRPFGFAAEAQESARIVILWS
jgi:hypothetical protein